MKRILHILFLVVVSSICAWSQGANTLTIEDVVDASGACFFGMIWHNTATNKAWICIGGSWQQIFPGSAAAAAFNTITDGTNTTAAMVVGTGASLGISGSGTIGGLTSTIFGYLDPTSPVQTQLNSKGTGTVTSVATTSPITGGAITGTGTIACATCVTSAAALASNAIVLGAGSQASAALGSLGTTTTLLHGNAAGAPTFAAVVSNDLNITTTTCTNQFVSALSAGAVGTCTTATLAGAQFANQGTTTTVLHGNGAGNPSFAGISLANDTTANQGTATTLLHGNGAGQPSFAAVSLTADVSGTLPVANGGTGLTAGTSGGVLAYTASGTLASSGALTANLPVIGGGAGVAPSVGTRSGNTTAYVTTTGTQTSGDCVKIDASGNHIANGSACGGGSSPLLYSGGLVTVNSNTANTATLFTYSLASGTMAINDCVRIVAAFKHTTGATASTYMLNFGATALTIYAGTVNTTYHSFEIAICNGAATTAQQWMSITGLLYDSGSRIYFNNTETNSYLTSAENTNSGSPIVISMTVAADSVATNAYTGYGFKVLHF